MSNNRGRPRRFNEEQVLEKVMNTFWLRGYGATTYAELESATGQRRQSLVYAFGDKHTMFVKALKHYFRLRLTEIEQALSNSRDPEAGIRNAVALMVEDAEHEQHRGCLMVTSAGEIGAFDPDIARDIEATRQRLVRLYTAAFARAAAQGQLRSGQNPESLATLLVSSADGSLLYARNARSGEDAERTLETLLQLIF